MSLLYPIPVVGRPSLFFAKPQVPGRSPETETAAREPFAANGRPFPKPRDPILSFAGRFRPTTGSASPYHADEKPLGKAMCVDAGQECGSQRSSARLRRGNHADPDLAAGPGGVRRPRSRPVRAFSALRFGCRRHSPWGVALALVLSIPVRALSRFVPRGLAILATVSVLLGGLRTRARLPGTAPDRAARRPVLLAARDRLRP